jgi:hypothetical protein
MVYISDSEYTASCLLQTGLMKQIEIIKTHPCDVFNERFKLNNPRDPLRDPGMFRFNLCQNLDNALTCKRGMCPITRKIYPIIKKEVPIEYVEPASRNVNLD